ncbi:Protein GrpE [Candidatus Sulfobium mesophilum]|uniref:Protein GrpE n=1 Tax=Candidatus Sulfobium mesophilum TaxID=2016548 RepID=A0A2U3QI83_9BACT|nr:Protein GrpE [Candidatus Sulfobium mesophilum]
MEERDMTDSGNFAEEGDEEIMLVEDEETKQEATEVVQERAKTADAEALQELNNKYLRLYAEFDNYKKRVNRDKEELSRYSNESLLYALLPVLDNLELALKHASCDPNTGVVQGVEITLKELQRTLEKFGLKRIEADGKEFDPAVHHAMMQVEREDMEEKMVAEELRAGYLYHEKVLRPSLVSVSVRPNKTEEDVQSE